MDDQQPWWGVPSRMRQLRAALAHVRPQRVVLVHDESAAVRDHLNPRCTWGTGKNTSDKGAYSTPAGIARHVGQMMSSLQCLRMLTRHEETYGIRFDYVTRSRPDLGFLAPLKPHCAFFFAGQPPAAHVDVSVRGIEPRGNRVP
jgi:hypothetical protein